jgi:hypothetical protein
LNQQLADASVVLVIVLVLISGAAVAIPLLGGLVMVGMGQSRHQPQGHDQGQGDQPSATQR